MLFRMDERGFTGEKVTSAVLKIYIKTKGKRRRRRIILHVSENTEDGKLAEFATIKLRVKRKGWQKINLPVYLLKKLQHQPIKLHVGCEKCNKRVRVVLPLKKSRKSQEFRDLGSRKRRSPIIVLNTKPSHPASAAAAVATAVNTRHLRRPRRDISRLGSRNPLPETAGPSVEQTVVEINTGSYSAKQLHPRLINSGGVGKSPTIAQRNRGFQDVDKGARHVPKRRKTTRSTWDEMGFTQANGNLENEETSSTGNNYDYSIDGDDDDDDDEDGSSFRDDDDDDDDDDNDDDEEAEKGDGEKKALGYNVNTLLRKDEEEDVFREEDGREEDSDEVLNKGCCMSSRFVSFKSIGLSGLVVRPLLGFVNNQCTDLCPTDRLHVTPPAKEDFGNSGVVVATHGEKHPAIPYWNKPQEVADSGPPEYTEQPKIRSRPFEENGRKSLLDKLRKSLNPRFSPEHPRDRPSFPLLLHLRQTKRQHHFRGRRHSMYYLHHYRHQEGQHGYNNLRPIRNDNGVNNINRKGYKNSQNSAKEKDSHKKNYKNFPSRRSCRPVEYKHLKLSFITSDLKIEKMTLPDAIVSKCGYV